MTSMLEHFGGSVVETVSTNGLIYNNGRMRVYNVTALGKSMLLPAANVQPRHVGGVQFLIVNIGIHTVTIRDNMGSVVGTVAPNKAARVWLSDDSSRAGVWHLVSTMIKGGSGDLWTTTGTTTTIVVTEASTITQGSQSLHR